MRRFIAIAGQLALAGGFLTGSAVFGQDPRLDELKGEVTQLSRLVADLELRIEDLERTPPGTRPTPLGRAGRGNADQERRIAELERVVRQLQAALAPAPKRIPSPTPQWLTPVNWGFIKKDMSEKQVVDLLGDPAHVTAVVDVRILYYQPDSKSTTPLHGSVTLKADRVIALEPPDF